MRKPQERTRIGLDWQYHEPGTAPGTLASVRASVGEPRITLIRYSQRSYYEKTVKSINECWGDQLAETQEQDIVTWINVEGYHEPELLRQLGNHYNLHHLALEDVLNAGQRPKLDTYGDYYFMVMYRLGGTEVLSAHQVSIFLSRRVVITLVEEEGGAFDLVRQRLRMEGGPIRSMGTDYLCYSLCDALIDQFFPLLERLGEKLDTLEDQVIDNPSRDMMTKIHHLKRELLLIERMAWAEREVINTLQREEVHLVEMETLKYIRDTYDHIIQIIEIIETFRDMATSILESYLTSINNSMNAVMKVLTVIATIFIPLTFIVGVYGMNFNTEAGPWNMPELNWRYGYLAVWAVMISLSVSMLIIFKRKKWI